MQMSCILKNPAGNRLVRFAGMDDVDWITSQVLSYTPLSKDWPEHAATGWVRWFVDHHFAAVLEENGKLIGLAMGRPCHNPLTAGAEYYHYEPLGKILYVDFITASDSCGVRLLWDFSQTMAIEAQKVSYHRPRGNIRLFDLEKVRGHFQPELN